MPISIPFVATGDSYPADSGGGGTILSHQLGKSISFTIANNPVAYQLGYLDKSGEIKWGEETPSNPVDGGFSNVAGIRFRSWSPGKPAVIVATLYLETDPTPLGSTAYTASLTASGGQTPGLSSVQIDHNGVATSTEPVLDFVDGIGTTNRGFLLGITDVPASSKALLKVLGPPIVDIVGGDFLPTTPENGLTVAYMPDKTNFPDAVWLMRWNSTSSFWAFIGGSELVQSDNNNQYQNAADNTWANIGGINAITLARAGIYKVTFGAEMIEITNAGDNVQLGVSVNGATPTGPWLRRNGNLALAGTQEFVPCGEITKEVTVTAGQTVSLQILSAPHLNVAIFGPSFSVRPRRFS